MSYRPRIAAAAAALALATSAAAPALAAALGPSDYVCTGIGADSREDPALNNYPLKLVFAKANGDYLSNIVVQLTDSSGAQVVDVLCAGPWFLAKLPAGSYKARFLLDGKIERTATVTAPVTGQKQVVVTFPGV